MMPLTLASSGEDAIVKKIGGKPEVKKHLENLGFVVGSEINVITEQNGNIIVKVKEARVAISKEMANIVYQQQSKEEKDENFETSKGRRNRKSCKTSR